MACSICGSSCGASRCRDCNRKYQKSYCTSCHGRAVRLWNSINRRSLNRSGRDPSYANIKVTMEREQFISWATAAIDTFQKQHPTDRPSLDRINPDGDYTLSNLRIISLSENSRLARTKAARQLLAREGKPWLPKPPAIMRKERLAIEREQRRTASLPIAVSGSSSPGPTGSASAHPPSFKYW